MAQKISYWLLITLVLSLGFGQLLRFDYYGLPLYLHDLLVVSILASLLPRRFLNRNSRLQVEKGVVATSRSLLVGKFGFNLFLAGLALGSIRALTHYPVTDLLIPFLYTLRLLAYLGLFISLKNSKFQISKKYFLVSALVCCFIGLLQYYLLPDMRVFQYLGWDDHLNRLTLPHFDPTFTGVMLSLALLITPLSRWYVSLLLSLTILLTYSRSVWLSLGITLATIIKPKKYLFILLPILLISIYLLPRRFGEGTNLLRTYSITSRIESDMSYIQKYQWDLLIGRGMNTMIIDSVPSKYSDHSTGPNNSYLYLLTTTGLLGLVGWGVFMYSLYLESSHKPMLIFFFIASLFNNVMFYPFSLLWILLIETQQKQFENLRI
ncbi:hypothetical protein KBD75_00670 [Candidatus Woesebacteria bacterium]|nr:hypothetical protein [Candidatus Woesebacteria bacterium]